MMKLHTCWKPSYKCIALIFNHEDPMTKEVAVTSLPKHDRYWGHKKYDDYNMHALGFYFFEICYYA